MVLIKNLGVILIILIIVVCAILAILVMLEKRLKKRVVKNQGRKNVFYIMRVEKASEIDPKDTLANLERITRDFFNDAFMLKPSADYSKLEKFFEQKGYPEIAEFCNMMNDALYSGKKSDKVNIEKLIISLKSIIKNNPLYTPAELERMQKESEKISAWGRLKNIGIPGVGKKEVDDKKNDSQ